MYHVNTNTFYQTPGFGEFVWLEAGWLLSLGGPGSPPTQDGMAFPLQKDMWTPVCFCKALPA